MVKSDLFWSRESELELNSFLGAKKPSMIKDDGTKPWIWVQKEESEPILDDVKAETLTQATEILAAVTDKVKAIEADPSIPTRANKAKGTRSKKDLREEAQAEAAEQLKTLSIESGETSGKWLLFRDGTRIDPTFATLARSLVDGPLSKTSADLMKVATCPHFDQEHYQHVICIYYPNVYDEAQSKEILRVAAEEHGIELSSVKSNLYTEMGLDSKHESKMRSTIWQPKELGFEKDTLKATIDAYWEKQKTAKAGDDDGNEQSGDGGATKRKAAGSDEGRAIKKSAAKRAKATFADDDSASSGDEDKMPAKPTAAKKTATAAKMAAKTKAKKTFDGGDGSSDEDKVKPTIQPASKAKSTTEKPTSSSAMESKGRVEAKKAELSGSETEPE